MHDDHHGTAIVAATGILNALRPVDRRIEDVRIVVNGAGAASLACLDLLVRFGSSKDNIIVCDSKGRIDSERDNHDQYKGAESGCAALGPSAAQVESSVAYVLVLGSNISSKNAVRSLNAPRGRM